MKLVRWLVEIIGLILGVVVGGFAHYYVLIGKTLPEGVSVTLPIAVVLLSIALVFHAKEDGEER